jgi:hypothetical protein
MARSYHMGIPEHNGQILSITARSHFPHEGLVAVALGSVPILHVPLEVALVFCGVGMSWPTDGARTVTRQRLLGDLAILRLLPFRNLLSRRCLRGTLGFDLLLQCLLLGRCLRGFDWLLGSFVVLAPRHCTS